MAFVQEVAFLHLVILVSYQPLFIFKSYRYKSLRLLVLLDITFTKGSGLKLNPCGIPEVGINIEELQPL